MKRATRSTGTARSSAQPELSERLPERSPGGCWQLQTLLFLLTAGTPDCKPSGEHQPPPLGHVPLFLRSTVRVDGWTGRWRDGNMCVWGWPEEGTDAQISGWVGRMGGQVVGTGLRSGWTAGWVDAWVGGGVGSLPFPAALRGCPLYILDRRSQRWSGAVRDSFLALLGLRGTQKDRWTNFREQPLPAQEI